MGEILFKSIYKSFGDVKVIEDLNLRIKDGEFTVLVGASGCGKTTVLRMIAGIGPASSGELLIDGENVADVPPGKRDIAMVFQNYAIYPTMTVKGNIEFGLINKKIPKMEREKRIKEVCHIVGLTPYLDRMPNELSGGQRQRVALARAMVKNPAVFLMDEPLSNLDAKLRATMRTELIELHHRLKTTFVYVTHDQAEAMSMADTIILMDAGKIMQQGAPEQIYNDPDNVFTAQFIGTPPMNIFPLKDGFVGFRPEKVQLSTQEVQGDYLGKGKILTRELLGSETLYKVAMDTKGGDPLFMMVRSTDNSLHADMSVCFGVQEKNLYFFDSEEKRVRKGEHPDYQRYFTMVKEAP